MSWRKGQAGSTHPVPWEAGSEQSCKWLLHGAGLPSGPIPADHKAINTNTACVGGETQVTGDETQGVPGLLAAFRSSTELRKISSITERENEVFTPGPGVRPASKLWVMDWGPLCILVNRFERSWAVHWSGKGTLGPRLRAFPPAPQMWPGPGCVGGDLMLKPTMKAGLGGFCIISHHLRTIFRQGSKGEGGADS